MHINFQRNKSNQPQTWLQCLRLYVYLLTMRFSAFAFCQICEGCVSSDEDFMREAGAEAEAGDETIEAIGVEKVGGDREGKVSAEG